MTKKTVKVTGTVTHNPETGDVTGNLQFENVGPVDPPVVPGPSFPKVCPISGIVIELIDGRYILSHPVKDVITHGNSGGYSAFSADDTQLQVYLADNGYQGTFYALDLETFNLQAVMKREQTGSTNSFVWGLFGKSYYELNGTWLYLRELGRSVSRKIILPVSSLPLTYRLQIGSVRSNPAIAVYNGQAQKTGILPFDPTDGTLSEIWWIKKALENGSRLNHTSETPAKHCSNMVSFWGGYAGVHQQSGRSHWFPADGSTAIAIEPKSLKRSHPAYRGKLCVFGNSSTSEIVCTEWSGAPLPNHENEKTVWEMYKPALKKRLWDELPNPNYIAMHHADIGLNSIAMTVLNQQRLGSTIRKVALLKVDRKTGEFAVVRKDLFRDESSKRFYESPRPSISNKDRWITYTLPMDNAGGNIRVFLEDTHV